MNPLYQAEELLNKVLRESGIRSSRHVVFNIIV